MTKKFKKPTGMPIGGPVKVFSLETGELLRIDKAKPGGIGPGDLGKTGLTRGTPRARKHQAQGEEEGW